MKGSHAVQPRDRAGRRPAADRRARRRDGALPRRGRAVRPHEGQDRPFGARPPRLDRRREADLRDGGDADEGRRGQDDDVCRAHAGARLHGPSSGALPARGICRARVRDQGRRRRRRLRAGRADGGPESPFHRRHPRHRRREQPAGGDPRGAPAARQRTLDRSALGRLAALRRHQRPGAPQRRDRARRPGERLRAGERVRHHGGLGGDGDRGRRTRPAGSPRAARRDHGRLLVRGRARARRAARRRGRDGRPPQGRAEAEPRPDARGAAGARALRALREHRARQQLARRRPSSP